MTTKKCSKCKKNKKIKFFGVKKYNKDGYNHYCKKCENERQKNNYRKLETKERIKYKNIFRLYGLTKEEYLNKIKEQNNRCSICKDSFEKIKPNVDHCHRTGKVRDMLCVTCNTVLGKLDENITYINELVEYIKKFSQ